MSEQEGRRRDEESDRIYGVVERLSKREVNGRMRERVESAATEFDNIRWDDVLNAVAEKDPDLATWTRKYVRYVREDLAAALRDQGGAP